MRLDVSFCCSCIPILGTPAQISVLVGFLSVWYFMERIYMDHLTDSVASKPTHHIHPIRFCTEWIKCVPFLSVTVKREIQENINKCVNEWNMKSEGWAGTKTWLLVSLSNVNLAHGWWTYGGGGKVQFILACGLHFVWRKEKQCKEAASRVLMLLSLMQNKVSNATAHVHYFVITCSWCGYFKYFATLMFIIL